MHHILCNNGSAPDSTTRQWHWTYSPLGTSRRVLHNSRSVFLGMTVPSTVDIACAGVNTSTADAVSTCTCCQI